MTENALPALGRLTRVPPREVWPHEAHSFAPWLLNNVDVLSDLLGMELALEVTEHPVGGFSLDLLGRDETTGEVVIVENQLETSDHPWLVGSGTRQFLPASSRRQAFHCGRRSPRIGALHG